MRIIQIVVGFLIAGLLVGLDSCSKPPTASFTSTPGVGEAPLEVQFDGSKSTPNGAITSYDWKFGDGTSGTGLRVTHTYTTPGAFTVQLTVTDNKRASHPATQTITVIAAPSDVIATTQDGKVALRWRAVSGASSYN